MSSTSTRAMMASFADNASDGGGGPASPLFDVILNGEGDFISRLSTAQAYGGRVILKFVGPPRTHRDSNSAFSLAMWKTAMDLAFNRASVAQVRAFWEQGTLLANWMLDDVKQGSNVFSGGAPTFADIEGCAEYSKSTWSFLPCTVRVDNQYLRDLCVDAGASHYTHTDFGWAQWADRFGVPLTWFTNDINAGRQVKLGCMLGMNLLDGGSGDTAPWNIHPNLGHLFGMSPQEITACADAFSQLTYAIGFATWAHNFDDNDYWHYTSIQTSLQYLADKADGRLQGPINWRDVSGSTSGSTQTVAGSWSYLGGSRYRVSHPSSVNVPLPSSVPANTLLGIVAYSRDSGRSCVVPSGWSEANRISGTSAQGGDLALFVKLADGSEAGGTQAIQLTGSATETAVQFRSFAFSGNTARGTPYLVAKAGSVRSWATGSADMGPVPGLTSDVSDALVLVVAAKTNDFANGDPVPDGTMSATTSGGETWIRMTLQSNLAGDDSGFLIDYTATSGTPSIATKSWTQLEGGSAVGSGCGFMVAFAPQSVVAGQPPALVELEDITMSVASTLSFTLASTGSTPITYSVLSGPSNITLNGSTGAFQWSPTTTGDFVIILRATNSFGTSEDDFVATIVSSGATSEGGSGSANAAPAITHPGDKECNAHDLLSFIVAASDADGDDIAFSLDQNPAGSFIDSATGQFIWIPSGAQGPGTYPIVVVASDGQTESRSTFTVTVNDTPWTRDGGPSTQLGRTTPDNQFRRL